MCLHGIYLELHAHCPSQGTNDKGNDKQDGKGHCICRIVCLHGKAGCCKKEIEYGDNQQRNTQSINAGAGAIGNQNDCQKIYHDDICFRQLKMIHEQIDSGRSQKQEYCKHEVTMMEYMGLYPPSPFLFHRLHISVRNDIDIKIGSQQSELIDQCFCTEVRTGRGTADNNLGNTADFGIFTDLLCNILSCHRYDIRMKMLRKTSVLFQLFQILTTKRLLVYIFYIQCRELCEKSTCHACSGTNNQRIAAGRAQTEKDMLPCGLAILQADAHIYPIRTTTQGYFTQCDEIISHKKIMHRLLCGGLMIDFPSFQTFKQLIRFYIHQLHLICFIKYSIRNTLLYLYSGDTCNHILQTFQMLYIHSRIHIDSRMQQLLNITIALRVPRFMCIGMRKLIYQYQLRMSLQCLIQIKFLQCNTMIHNRF